MCWFTCAVFLLNMQTFYPVSPGNFAEKRVLKLVELFSSHCLVLKSWNLPQIHLCGLLIQMKNIHLKLGHVQKTSRFLGLKDTQQSLLFVFSFSPLLFFCFSFFIFPFAGHLVVYKQVGKVFGKAFRILVTG